MKRLIGGMVVGLMVVMFGFANVAAAEDGQKFGSPFIVKIGEDVWEVTFNKYFEKPDWGGRKKAGFLVDFVNKSPEKAIQKISGRDWSFYLIDSEKASYKAADYLRDPGRVHWYKEEVLPGAPFKARIEVSIPKEVVASRVMLMADVGIPAQVTLDVPESEKTKMVAPPVSAAEERAVEQPAVSAKEVRTSFEQEARFGYGAMGGHILGLSGVFWADPLGGQIIVSRAGAGSAIVSARVHLKFFAVPFGRLSLAPQVGYEFNPLGGSSGTISKTSYGLVGVAEFVMPFPVGISAGKNLLSGSNSWLQLFAFEKAKAIGLSAEIGFYGNNIRNIVLQPGQLTPGFSSAVHIYL